MIVPLILYVYIFINLLFLLSFFQSLRRYKSANMRNKISFSVFSTLNLVLLFYTIIGMAQLFYNASFKPPSSDATSSDTLVLFVISLLLSTIFSLKFLLKYGISKNWALIRKILLWQTILFALVGLLAFGHGFMKSFLQSQKR